MRQEFTKISKNKDLQSVITLLEPPLLSSGEYDFDCFGHDLFQQRREGGDDDDPYGDTYSVLSSDQTSRSGQERTRLYAARCHKKKLTIFKKSKNANEIPLLLHCGTVLFARGVEYKNQWLTMSARAAFSGKKRKMMVTCRDGGGGGGGGGGSGSGSGSDGGAVFRAYPAEGIFSASPHVTERDRVLMERLEAWGRHLILSSMCGVLNDDWIPYPPSLSSIMIAASNTAASPKQREPFDLLCKVEGLTIKNPHLHSKAGKKYLS